MKSQVNQAMARIAKERILVADSASLASGAYRESFRFLMSM